MMYCYRCCLDLGSFVGFRELDMSSGFGESAPQSPSCSSSNANECDPGDFECNICFELAQDPIITLCGHLYCWPCLYRWLHHHSQCQECPVCKALVQEEKLIPLYGRGKTQTDPRSKSYPGISVPNRPAGQRPETALLPEANQFTNHRWFGFMGGFMPMATSRIGNFTLASAFTLFPAFLNIHYHTGLLDATVYGTTTGFPYGLSSSFHGGHAHGFPQPINQRRQVDHVLKNLFLLVGVFVIAVLIFC